MRPTCVRRSRSNDGRQIKSSKPVTPTPSHCTLFETHTHTLGARSGFRPKRGWWCAEKSRRVTSRCRYYIYILGIYICIYPKPAWPTTSVCFRGHKKSCGVVLAAYMATSTRLLQSNLPWRSWGKVCGPIVGTSFVTGNFGCRIGSDQIGNCLRQLATVKRKDCDFKLWNWSSYAKVTRGQSHVSPSLLPSLSGCIVGPSQLCQLLNIDWCLGLSSLLRT